MGDKIALGLYEFEIGGKEKSDDRIFGRHYELTDLRTGKVETIFNIDRLVEFLPRLLVRSAFQYQDTIYAEGYVVKVLDEMTTEEYAKTITAAKKASRDGLDFDEVEEDYDVGNEDNPRSQKEAADRVDATNQWEKPSADVVSQIPKEHASRCAAIMKRQSIHIECSHFQGENLLVHWLAKFGGISPRLIQPMGACGPVGNTDLGKFVPCCHLVRLLATTHNSFLSSWTGDAMLWSATEKGKRINLEGKVATVTMIQPGRDKLHAVKSLQFRCDTRNNVEKFDFLLLFGVVTRNGRVGQEFLKEAIRHDMFDDNFKITDGQDHLDNDYLVAPDALDESNHNRIIVAVLHKSQVPDSNSIQLPIFPRKPNEQRNLRDGCNHRTALEDCMFLFNDERAFLAYNRWDGFFDSTHPIVKKYSHELGSDDESDEESAVESDKSEADDESAVESDKESDVESDQPGVPREAKGRVDGSGDDNEEEDECPERPLKKAKTASVKIGDKGSNNEVVEVGSAEYESAEYYVGSRIAKKRFDDGVVHFGTVMGWSKRNGAILWNVEYADNDGEEIAARELRTALKAHKKSMRENRERENED
ncbi:MAG: hypothetical protein SGILL_008290 [Bacillariaceae sp.]